MVRASPVRSARGAVTALRDWAIMSGVMSGVMFGVMFGVMSGVMVGVMVGGV